jgi:hypothetical protein
MIRGDLWRKTLGFWRSSREAELVGEPEAVVAVRFGRVLQVLLSLVPK